VRHGCEAIKEEDDRCRGQEHQEDISSSYTNFFSLRNGFLWSFSCTPLGLGVVFVVFVRAAAGR